MKSSERQWPAQQAPDDFADRVVRAGLEAARAGGVALAELRDEAVERELPARAEGTALSAFVRRVVAWRFAAVAAAVAIGAIAAHWMHAKPEAEVREHVSAPSSSPIAEEVTRQADEIVELRAKVAALESDLGRTQLKAKLAEAQRAQSGARAAGSASARPATPRRACNCAPGDPLCTCL